MAAPRRILDSPTASERSAAAVWWIPILVACLALAARLYGLGSKPLWYDEVLTLKRATLPFGELVADSFHNKHYPLYFLLMKPFATADWSAAALRLPACVFGALAAMTASRIAGDVAGRGAALVAGALVALSPLEVQYGQEARPYTLASAAILTAVWGASRLLLAAERCGSADGVELRHQPGAWIAYALGMVVALNTIGAAAPSFIAMNVIVTVLAVSRRLRGSWPMRTWQLVNALVLLAWLPGLASLLLANASSASRGLNWVPPLTWDLAQTVLGSLYLFQLSDLVTFERLSTTGLPVGLAVLAAAVAGARRVSRDAAGALLIGLVLAMPTTLALVSLGKPLFVPRYLLWSTGPYFVLAGIGVAGLAAALPRGLVSASIIVGAVLALWPYYGAETKPRWDLAATYLAQHAEEGDVTVVSSGLARLMLDTYVARQPRSEISVRTSPKRDEITRAFEGGANVWLIHGRAGQGGSLVARETFAGNWRELGPARDVLSFGRHIVISRHAKPTDRH